MIHVPRQPARIIDVRRQTLCGVVVKTKFAPIVPLNDMGQQVLPTKAFFRGFAPTGRCLMCYDLCPEV